MQRRVCVLPSVDMCLSHSRCFMSPGTCKNYEVFLRNGPWARRRVEYAKPGILCTERSFDQAPRHCRIERSCAHGTCGGVRCRYDTIEGASYIYRCFVPWVKGLQGAVSVRTLHHLMNREQRGSLSCFFFLPLPVNTNTRLA